MATVSSVLPSDDWSVRVFVPWFIMVYVCPTTTPVVGSFTVCTEVPVKTCTWALVMSRVVVPATMVVVCTPSIKLLAERFLLESHSASVEAVGVVENLTPESCIPVPDVFEKVAISPTVELTGPVTFPAPEGVAQVPSPLQKVELEAEVPEFRLVTGRFPVTSFASRTVRVLLAPLMVLLVRVSVVALPTKVSVEVGRVRVPVLLIVLITGEVRVLLVRVCAELRSAMTFVPVPESLYVPETLEVYWFPNILVLLQLEAAMLIPYAPLVSNKDVPIVLLLEDAVSFIPSEVLLAMIQSVKELLLHPETNSIP